MAIETFPPGLERALEALADYEYMTTAHMVAAGVSASENSLRKNILPRLDRPTRPYVDRARFGKGKYDVFCLTERGAALAAELMEKELSDIHFPKGGVQFTDRDYLHRLRYIDCHIALRKWAADSGNQVFFCDNYHHKIGSQRGRGAESQGITRLNFRRPTIGRTWIEPDGIALFSTYGKTRLAAIELHRKTSTTYITEQLERLMVAMEEGLVSDKYELEMPSYVFSIHHQKATFENVRKRLTSRPDFPAFSSHFLFNTYDQVMRDFSKGWIYANGSSSDVFDSKAQSER